VALRLYLDEQVSDRLADALRDLGHEVATTGGLGNKGLSDPRQVLVAAESDRVLVTYNAQHFRILHEAWGLWSRTWSVSEAASHPGILILYPGKGIDVALVAAAIHELAGLDLILRNRLLAWTPRDGWWDAG
jgi:Domain of unknown function (DUF5615)